VGQWPLSGAARSTVNSPWTSTSLVVRLRFSTLACCCKSTLEELKLRVEIFYLQFCCGHPRIDSMSFSFMDRSLGSNIRFSFGQREHSRLILRIAVDNLLLLCMTRWQPCEHFESPFHDVSSSADLWTYRRGPGAAALAGLLESNICHISILTRLALVWQNLNHRLSIHLLAIFVYFAAAWGTTSTFSPSFTFETYNQSVDVFTSSYSITAAMSRIPDGPQLITVRFFPGELPALVLA
jgi:hypothetical protein